VRRPVAGKNRNQHPESAEVEFSPDLPFKYCIHQSQSDIISTVGTQRRQLERERHGKNRIQGTEIDEPQGARFRRLEKSAWRRVDFGPTPEIEGIDPAFVDAILDAQRAQTRKGETRQESPQGEGNRRTGGRVMVASNQTIEAIYSAVRRHVTDEQMQSIIADLLKIAGNKSFRDTVKRLAAINARTK
jgi:hypothetical protein